MGGLGIGRRGIETAAKSIEEDEMGHNSKKKLRVDRPGKRRRSAFNPGDEPSMERADGSWCVTTGWMSLVDEKEGRFIDWMDG